MRALITGMTGFVGSHLKNYLINEKGWEIWGVSRSPSSKVTNMQVPLLDTNWDLEDLKRKIDLLAPDYIFHLAGQSNVKRSWENTRETFEANVLNTINLLEAVRSSRVAQTVKVITVGSSEEYGQVDASLLPIIESTPPNPGSPYGVSKLSVSMLAKQYYESYKLQIIHVRPFNHIGPGQGLGFVVSDFAYQVASIEEGLQEPVLYVGNLSAKRDFLDVRDIVRAYAEIACRGQPGEIYNICSGKPVEIRTLLELLIKQSTKPIEIKVDSNRLRPVDVPYYYGSNEKIKEQLGIIPTISLEESLKDIYEYWRCLIRNEGSI